MEGPDAPKFAQRMFSRDMDRIAEGRGALTCFLSAEAKVLEIFWTVRLASQLWLITESNRIDSLKALIERYHFSEAFSLKEGPDCGSLWQEVPDHGDGRGSFEGHRFSGVWRSIRFVFDFESVVSSQEEFGPWESTRIRNLIPSWNFDFDQSTLVFDSGFEELCDPGKGCYIGQEVVERVRTRGGNFPRRLSLLEWESKPIVGSEIRNQSGEGIGQLTRSLVQAGESFFSLAYLKRGKAELGALVFESSTGSQGLVRRILQ